MAVWPVVLAAVAAAAAFALSGSLKHVSTADAPDAGTMAPRALGRFVAATLVHRLWLLAIVCDVAGVGLQALALHLGRLAVVQPVLISALPMTLLIRSRFRHHHLTRPEVLWSMLLTASLAGFLVVTLTAHARAGSDVDRGAAYIAAAVGLGIAVVSVELGRRGSRRPGGRRPTAAFIGVAVGLVYATTAALLKSITGIVARHPAHLLVSWQLYLAVLLGAGGMLLGQLALQAGPLAASLAATSTIDPLASIVIGVVVFDEQVVTGPWRDAALACLLALLTTAAIQLSRPTADEETASPSSGRGDEWDGSGRAAA